VARVYIVSNRVSTPRKTGENSAGGLEVAVRAVLKRHRGTWFGWSGAVSSERDLTVRSIDSGDMHYLVTDLTREEYEEYYKGFANSVLWPILHYRLDLAEFSRRDLSGYMRVNERLARELHKVLKRSDIVWVHDYHLIPFAKMLRDMGHENRIGFFLHVPLPPPEILTALPNYEQLLSGFLAYDLVGFQTETYTANFARFLAQEFGMPNHIPRGNLGDAARMHIGTFPVGIDAQGFRAEAEKAVHSSYVRKVLSSLSGALIIGVDRLDYTKGLPLRVEGYESFLKSHPNARGNVTYLQITPKSRSQIPEYADIQHQLERAAGRINGNFGDAGWTPIRYVNRAHSRHDLAGLYRAARVGLVTPLRDGMNLVAKEYVAAQDPADPGVLILSKFAGAAAELREALLVNPHDREAVGAAIGKALDMPLAERKRRYAALFDAVLKSDISRWAENFLDTLVNEPAAAPPPQLWSALEPKKKFKNVPAKQMAGGLHAP
jgi:trehalose 6-phosphate synthase